MTQKDEIQLLIRRSEEFLETADYQINQGYFGLAVFSLEQALELFLKSLLLVRGFDYPRTHSLRSLMEILIDLDDSKEKDLFPVLLEKFLLELGMLEDAYITSRYIIREFSKKEATKLKKAVEEIIEKCRIRP